MNKILILLFITLLHSSIAFSMFPGCDNITEDQDWWIVYKDYWFETVDNEDEDDEQFDSEREVNMKITQFLKQYDGFICVRNFESISQTQSTLKKVDDNEANAPKIVEKARSPSTPDRELHDDVIGTVYRVWFVTNRLDIFESTLSSKKETIVSGVSVLSFSLLHVILADLFLKQQ